MSAAPRVMLGVLGIGLAGLSVALWIAVRSEAAPPPPTAASPRAPTATVEPPPQALPQPLPAAAASDDGALATLRESGAATEPWDGAANAVLDAIGRRALATSRAGCFVAGCAATYTFASAADRDRARADIEASADYRAWTGGKRWSDLEALAGGNARVAVLLYRPD